MMTGTEKKMKLTMPLTKTEVLYYLYRALSCVGIHSLGFGLYRSNKCGIQIFKMLKLLEKS
jgi:hypothetical protein